MIYFVQAGKFNPTGMVQDYVRVVIFAYYVYLAQQLV